MAPKQSKHVKPVVAAVLAKGKKKKGEPVRGVVKTLLKVEAVTCKLCNQNTHAADRDTLPKVFYLRWRSTYVNSAGKTCPQGRAFIMGWRSQSELLSRAGSWVVISRPPPQRGTSATIVGRRGAGGSRRPWRSY